MSFWIEISRLSCILEALKHDWCHLSWLLHKLLKVEANYTRELTTTNQLPLWLKGNKIKLNLKTVRNHPPRLPTRVCATQLETPRTGYLESSFWHSHRKGAQCTICARSSERANGRPSIVPAFCLGFLSLTKFPFKMGGWVYNFHNFSFLGFKNFFEPGYLNTTTTSSQSKSEPSKEPAISLRHAPLSQQ